MSDPTKYSPANSTFSVWDYVVFGAVLAASAGIGIYYGCTGGRQRTTSEFLMADRKMHVLPVTMSLLASFLSAITLLGTPAEIYVFGARYWLLSVGHCIAIPIATYVFLPILYDLRLTSVFEYIQQRFGYQVRLLACLCYIVQMTLYMAIVLYTPCLALSVVTGFNKWIAVWLVGVVCTFYTTIGGMKAVMWTDTLQVGVMTVGLVAVLTKGALEQGGFGKLWTYMDEGERLNVFDLSQRPLEQYSVWGLVFGGAFTWLAIYGVNQAIVQRVLCCPRKREGQVAMWFNLPGLIVILALCCLCGIVIYAEYRFCDPLLMHRIEAKDQLLPRYVMDKLDYPGLPGLFTASLFSAALSSISSGLNSLTAVTTQDLILGRCRPMSERRMAFVAKVLALCYGVLMIALSYITAQFQGVLQAAGAVFGMIGGPILGLFTLGILFPWVNHAGSFVGLMSGVVVSLWIGLGAQVYKPHLNKAPVNISGCFLIESNATAGLSTVEDILFSISTEAPNLSSRERSGYLPIYEVGYLWYAVIAVIVTVLVGMLVSACTGFSKLSEINPKLIHPIVYKCCCCYSAQIEKALHSGAGNDCEKGVTEYPETGMLNDSGVDFEETTIQSGGHVSTRDESPPTDRTETRL